MQFFVDPFHRMFTIDDTSIQYPYAEVERVPPGRANHMNWQVRIAGKLMVGRTVWLLVYAAGIPLATITVWAVVVRPPVQKVHVTYLGLLLRYMAVVSLDLFDTRRLTRSI